MKALQEYWGKFAVGQQVLVLLALLEETLYAASIGHLP